MQTVSYKEPRKSTNDFRGSCSIYDEQQ